MKNVCVEITVPIIISFEVEDAVAFDRVALLQATKEVAQSAWDDNALDIQFDVEDNGIRIVSVDGKRMA